LRIGEKNWGGFFLSSKGLFFGWGERRGNFQPLQRGFFLSERGFFSILLWKRNGKHVFFKRGGDLSKGLFLGWSGRGLVVSQAKGVVFFPLFSKNFFLDEVR